MKEKIVLLDAATLTMDDIDFSKLNDLGDVTIYNITHANETAERVKGASIIITNKVLITEEIMKAAPGLKLVAITATGYNNIDLEAAKKQGITVTNVAGYSTFSVAQATMAFILACAGNLIKYNRACHDGSWSSSPIFTMLKWPVADLKGKTLGIIGMGNIGKEVARMARVFGMNICALGREGVKYDDDSVKRMSLFELAKVSDFITIHAPLTDETHHLINTEFFCYTKETAFLINMARGPIVKPAALYGALYRGDIAGAAADVMENEPPHESEPLLALENFIMTPHTAWASYESRTRLLDEVVENIDAFLKGSPRNVVQ